MNALSTQLLSRATWLLLALVSVVAGLVAAGIFDPLPRFAPVAAPYPARLDLVPGPPTTVWLAPASHRAWRLSASLSAEADSAFGLLVGQPGACLAAAVSPTGTVSIWLCEMDGERVLLPWQPWPHVRQGLHQPNELVIRQTDTQLSVWVNREKLWQREGQLVAKNAGMAIWAQTFAGPAQLTIHDLSAAP